jgi:hypothetical protein
MHVGEERVSTLGRMLDHMPDRNRGPILRPRAIDMPVSTNIEILFTSLVRNPQNLRVLRDHRVRDLYRLTKYRRQSDLLARVQDAGAHDEKVVPEKRTPQGCRNLLARRPSAEDAADFGTEVGGDRFDRNHGKRGLTLLMRTAKHTGTPVQLKGLEGHYAASAVVLRSRVFKNCIFGNLPPT